MSKSDSQTCFQHKYCIHQHYQKCRKQRQRSISYTIYPDDQINVLSNVHKKCTNQYCYNFPTLAYEKYTLGKQPETETDRNFIKNYYLQNVPQQMQFTNQIVKQLQNEVFPFNAYNMAQNATKQYKAFQFKRQQYLITAQRRAKNNTKAFFQNLNHQKTLQHNQNSKWIKKIIMGVQQMGERMFGLITFGKQNKDTSNKDGVQRVFLNQKKHVNEKYLSQFKINDIKSSQQIFEDIRAQMLKNKRKYDEQRLNNRNNTFTASMISQTSNHSKQTQNNKNIPVQQSMISNHSQIQVEMSQQQLIQKLCDFQKLKRKWKAQDVQTLKDIIVRFLTKKIILNCQEERSKQQRHAKKQDKLKVSPARKQYYSHQKNKANSTTSKNQKSKKFQSLNKTVSTIQQKPIFKQKLSKEEQEKKSAILKGGQFDIMGLKYERNRNYSDLFRKRGDNFTENLSLNFISQIHSSHHQKKQNNKRVVFQQNKFQGALKKSCQNQKEQKYPLASTARDTKRQTDRASSSLPKGSKTSRTRCL